MSLLSIAVIALLSGPATATGSTCDATSNVAPVTIAMDLGDVLQLTLPFIGFGQEDSQRAKDEDGGWRLPNIPWPSWNQPVLGGHAARRSVIDTTRQHREQLERTGIGTHYGDGSTYHRLSDEEREAWLTEHTRDGAVTPQASSLTRSSCIEWAMEHVRAYYEAMGDLETWEAIQARVRDENLQGTSLARELQAAGWTVVYLNADGSYQGVTDHDGEHVYSKRVVQEQGTYYGVPVDEAAVDWEADPDGKLGRIERAPFFVMVARGGLHVTAGVDGQISELSRGEGPHGQVLYQDPLRDIIDVYANEVYDGGEDGQQGARRMWGSGLVLLPPGT